MYFYANADTGCVIHGVRIDHYVFFVISVPISRGHVLSRHIMYSALIRPYQK
jgi:hypothetical protein